MATELRSPRSPAPGRPAPDRPVSRTAAAITAIGLPAGAQPDVRDQDERKYTTGNPVVRALIARLVGAVRDVVGPVPGRLVDVGVGEGLALERIAPGVGAVGLEYRRSKLRVAADRIPGLRPVVADAGVLPLRDGAADTVTCCEVLEHLDPFPPAVAELARITGAGGRCIVTVPWEPWFRLGNLSRGRNVRRGGNDIEHVQQFTPARLGAALLVPFAEAEVRTCFPWLIGVARRPRRA